MATLSSFPNFSVSPHATRSHKVHFASAEPVSTQPTETQASDVVSKSVNAAPPVSSGHGDTLVKSAEKASNIPDTPAEWAKHILSQVPEQEKTPDLEKALQAHFQEMQQTYAPFEQEIRKVIGGPNAKDMSRHELAAEILKITLADPTSEAAEKIQKINSEATAAILPLQQAFLKSQNEAVQKAYFGVLEKAMHSPMGETVKKVHDLEPSRSSLSAEFMDDYRKAFLQKDIKDIVAYSKQSMEHGVEVLKRIKQFLSDNHELATKFEAKRDLLPKVFEYQHDELDTAFKAKRDELTRKFRARHNRLDKKFEAKRDELTRKFEAKQDELGTKFEAELDELSKKFRTYMQENNPFGELFQKWITKKL